MKEFFLILFFSKTLLLTDVPLTFEGHQKIPLKEPISAITGGASIRIDITKMIEPDLIANQDAEKIWQYANRMVPKNSISGVLTDQNGKTINLRYDGASSMAPGSIQLVLFSDESMPTDVDFTELTLFSSVLLKDVQIYWKNYQH